MTAQNISDDHKFHITTAPRRDSRHWKADFTTWSDIKDWMLTPANTKECGNYVLGSFRETTATVDHPMTHPKESLPCTNLHRSKTSIEFRGALTLDVDQPTAGFLERAATLEYAYILHTTFKSTPAEPRYRLIVPLSRTVAPDEYHTAAASVMQALGEDSFDPGSVQAERYMFKPSAGAKKNFWYEVHDGPVADVESLLEGFQADLSSVPLPKPNRSKRDPFTLPAPIGVFNTVYDDIATLVEKFDLPYQEDGSDRWHLVGASAAAGMGQVTPGLYYSHHSNDPAYGQTCSAFDLVRLHLFGDLDENAKEGTPINKLPSTLAMLDFAKEDQLVVDAVFSDQVAADFKPVSADDSDRDWRTGFQLNRAMEPTDDIRNWDLISANDPGFTGLYYNELTMTVECSHDLPWRPVTPDTIKFKSGDRSALLMYIERTYRIRPSAAWLDHMIAERVNTVKVNPVKDYLEALVWDGTPRVETCLPGVRPDDNSRLSARKALTAAAARMLQPGIKWDHMLVLYGDEGLGKSFWVEKMARGWSSNLGPIDNKDTLVSMQRSWILTSDEGHSMKKADFDAQKEFITRTADLFRMPYDREPELHPRHNVIWGTTNDDAFLTKQRGNRRFLIVTCQDKVDFDAMTDEYVDQVWAEAVHLFRSGERLWLNEEETAITAGAREVHTAENPHEGTIGAYLETLVPENWDELSILQRQAWLNDYDNGMVTGTKRIDEVCTRQIWFEAYRNMFDPRTAGELRPHAKVMSELPGWTKMPGRPTCGPYGQQLVFRRNESLAEDLI